MTLQEKLKKEGFSNCDYLEQVADDFAIGFAEWLLINDLYSEILLKISTTKELLEIYKKEKGLC